MNSASDEFLPTRQSLLDRLKNLEDHASWQTFFDRYWRLIYSVARKSGLSDAEAQDVVQETIISVSKKIQGFTYDPSYGSFKGWLKRLTQWRVGDHQRRKQYQLHGQRRPKEDPLATSLAEVLEDPAVQRIEESWNEEWERNLLETALENLKLVIRPIHYQVFHLHVARGYPARRVAEQLGIKLAEVYVAKYKVSTLVRKEIKRLTRQLD